MTAWLGTSRRSCRRPSGPFPLHSSILLTSLRRRWCWPNIVLWARLMDLIRRIFGHGVPSPHCLAQARPGGAPAWSGPRAHSGGCCAWRSRSLASTAPCGGSSDEARYGTVPLRPQRYRACHRRGRHRDCGPWEGQAVRPRCRASSSSRSPRRRRSRRSSRSALKRLQRTTCCSTRCRCCASCSSATCGGGAWRAGRGQAVPPRARVAKKWAAAPLAAIASWRSSKTRRFWARPCFLERHFGSG
mmetsp:Transcript_148845/g.378670  ORF Transcript_148845/g.378670 Transcript_148845/m.378670 type:complete len:244 (-) Transcript_148845:411-1142(-)